MSLDFQPSRPDVLHISLIGDVSVSLAGETIDVKSKKLSAILGYISLNNALVETREHIVGLFWSESDEVRARGSLRQSLRRLRCVLNEAGFDGLHTDKTKVSLDPQLVDVDVWNVISQAEEYKIDAALLHTQRYTEKLLEGYEDTDPGFRVWLLAFRQSLHERLMRALEEGLAARDQTAASKNRIAEAIVNLDPTHELACRYLMHSRASSGDISGALKTYNALWNLLDEEYDMEPTVATIELVARIKAGDIVQQEDATEDAQRSNNVVLPLHKPEQAPLLPVPSERPILIVEPFVTETMPPERTHFVQGFRHTLIACLVRFREWRISEKSSGVDGDPDINPKYSVHTTASMTDSSAYIVITLKDLHTESYVWSDRFELQVENWWEMQNRVVRRITTALNIHLSAERLSRITNGPSLPAQLYDQWLRGQSLILNFSPQNWQEASTIFRAVIDEAPRFAPAYSSLVQLGNTAHIAQPGVFRTKPKHDENLNLAKTAVALDPIDSRAQLCLAWAYAFSGRYDLAKMHFDLAIDLNDHDPWTLISAGQGHAFLGDKDRAKPLCDKALDSTMLPNQSHWGYHAGVRFFRGDYAGALDAAKRSGDSLVNNGAWRAASYYHLGHKDRAREEATLCLNHVRERWHSDTTPTDSDIASWILQLFPIRHKTDWQRLKSGLGGAGIPVEDANHINW